MATNNLGPCQSQSFVSEIVRDSWPGLLSLSKPAARLPRPDLHLDVAALLAFPLLLLFVNNSWLIAAPHGAVDAYVYTGYMLDLRHHIEEFGPTYYGSRLPWILFGSAAHSLASFEVANLFLRLTLFYMATFALYITIHLLWKDRLIAALVALLLGSNAYFLWAISWDYVDGAGIVLLLTVLACLTAARQNKHRDLVLVIAGALTITAISVQIFLIALMPPLVAWYVLIGREINVKRVIKDIMFVLVGVVVAFAFYGIMSLHLGGDFNYLQPQIDAARTLDPSAYKALGYVWLDKASWLAVPATVLLTVVVLLLLVGVRHVRERGQSFFPSGHATVALATVPLLLAVGSFVYFQIRGGAELQHQFYADYLLPFTFLALSGPLFLSLTGMKARRRALAGAVLIVLVLLPFVSGQVLPFARPPDIRLSDGYLYLMVAAAGLLVAGARFQSTILGITAVALLSLLNVGTSDSRILYFSGRDTVRASAYLIPQTYEHLSHYSDNGQLRYWYNFDEPFGPIYRGVASMDLFRYRLVSEDFPKRTNPNILEVSRLKPGETIAIFSSRSDALELATTQLGHQELGLELLDRVHSQRGKVAFDTFIVRVLPGGFQPVGRASLSGLQASGGSNVSPGDGDSVSIETLPKPWYYAAVLPLPVPAYESARSPAYIRVRGQVRGGPIGVGLLNRTQSEFLDRVPLANQTSADIFLRVEHLEDAAFLIVQTWDKAREGRMILQDVTVYLPSDQE